MPLAVAESAPAGSIVDVDLSPSGKPAALIATGKERRLAVEGRTVAEHIDASFVRWLDDHRVLVVRARNDRVRENATCYGGDGSELWHAALDDGVEDVIALDRSFAVTYFDEGVFGDRTVAREGIAVFDHSGKFQRGWNSRPPGEFLSECYAAAPLSGAAFVFCAFAGFKLVHFDVVQWKAKVYDLGRRPAAVTGLADGNLAVVDLDRNVFAFNVLTEERERIGSLRSRTRVRGIRDGRFLEIGFDEVRLARVPAPAKG